MAAFSVQNAAVLAATLLFTGFSGGQCALISHESMLVSRRSQLMAVDASVAEAPRRNLTGKPIKAMSFMEASASKPIRIIRHGEAGAAKPKGGEGHVSKYKCGSTHKVNSGSDKDEVCPSDCPFFAQNRQDDDFCTFACVAEPECPKMFPKTNIGDKDLGVCRSCVVEGCQECDTTVQADKCAKCQWAYNLTPDGQCTFRFYSPIFGYLLYGIYGILAVVAIWVLDMAIRPVYNQEGLDKALANREKCKLLQDKDAEGNRKPWSLFTNLTHVQVAGPGMMLHFNFQVALMIWAIFVALCWVAMCVFIDEDLWRLGTRRFGTPRMNCILVAWGYETQQRLMWTKVLFLVIVYLGSFFGAIVYGIYQMRAFEATDVAHKTMKDYVVMITGLPHSLTGASKLEDEIKDEMEKQIPSVKGKIVGVSVCWEYGDHEEQIDKYLHEELEKDEEKEWGPKLPAPDVNPIRKQLMAIEASLLDFDDEDKKEEAPAEEAPAEAEAEVPMEQLLEQMHASSRAFVVLNTEEDRDAAVEHGEFEFKDAKVSIKDILGEPDTVNWQNFGKDSAQQQMMKLLAGFGFIGLACGVWALLFYSPYAYYVMTFNYENGRQPGFVVGFSFSMIVCVGNVIMYEVCGRISDWVGFRFRDEREACYMILYTTACMFNVALDFVTTYFTAEMVMEGLGFKTYFGVPLSEVPTFTGKFETYGMQRSLAENTYSYAFPSTYLIPFLIEPFPTIALPLIVGRWLVKSHVGARGRAAEEWLEMAPMDMGRYADLLLNAILGILIFYFPGGYTWQLFFGMAGSHLYIYLFDQYKVLRSIPACRYASFDIEWCCQAMFAPIIGIMASCLTFKANCEPGMHCTTGAPLIMLCCLAWLVHTTVHLVVLWKVVPMFKAQRGEDWKDPEEGKTYQQVAASTPVSWFSMNKVHCLRSKLKFGHSPPCSHMILGKEQYMKANPSIGCYYHN